jgi:hypothetical protein
MKYIAILLIKFYRKCISPLFPAKCKYHPTCSAYALTAVQRFGFIRGTLLAGWRILRCNPWSMGGIDPVPEKFTFKVKKYQYSDFASDDENYDNIQND